MVFLIFHDGVVLITGPKLVKVICWVLLRLKFVRHLIYLVVHDFSKIENHIVLQLNLSFLADLDSRVVDDACISDIIISVF